MSFPFGRLVVWGGCGEGETRSHSHIHRHFAVTARKLGIPVLWVDDEPAAVDALEPGALVLAADLWSDHLVARPGVSYVLHNFDGSHPLCRSLESTPERHLRLQVWSRDAVGESWGPARSFSREGRILFQPWGTDLLAEEFREPVVNPRAREAVFVGSVWGEVSGGEELGNRAAIDELGRALETGGLILRHLTGVSDAENVRAVRESRLAPAIAGAWQVRHDYFPCRAFKNVSYGQLGITNVPGLRALLGGCIPGGRTVTSLIEEALARPERDVPELVREQQRVVCGFTYRESLATIARAFEELGA